MLTLRSKNNRPVNDFNGFWCQRFEVLFEGVSLGWCCIDWYYDKRLACGHYDLNPDVWGKGYGSQLQDIIEETITTQGFIVSLAPNLSHRAYRMLMKRCPEKVSSHVPLFEPWWTRADGTVTCTYHSKEIFETLRARSSTG